MRLRRKPRSVEEKFRRHIILLREKLPPLLPVLRVYRRPLKDCLGYTNLLYDDEGKPRGFVISVERAMSWDATWQITIHEWAHAIAWHEGHESVEDHGPEWGLAVARCYQESVER